MAAIHHNTLKKAAAHKIKLVQEDGEIVASRDGIMLATGLQGNKVLEAAIAKLVEQHPVTKAIAKVTGKSVVEITKTGVKVKSAPAAKPVEPPSPFEIAARAEGWKPLRGGGYIRKTPGEDSDNSEAASWEELCEEQEIEVASDEGDEAEEEGGGKSLIKDKYKKIYAQTAVKGTNGDDLAARLREYLTVETEDGPRIDRKKMQRFAEANEVWIAAYRSMKPGLVRMNIANRLRGNGRKAQKAGETLTIKWVD